MNGACRAIRRAETARIAIGLACLLACWLGVGAPASGDETPAAGNLERFEFTETHMGAPVKLIFYSPDQQNATRAADAVYARFSAIDRVMSDYHSTTELSKLSATAGSGKSIPVSDSLWRVLTTAETLSKRSDGAFDVTVGPLVQLWRRARKAPVKQLPAGEELQRARAAVGYKFLRLDAEKHTALLEKPGMRLDLGGIASGYAVDQGLSILREHGVNAPLIDASGDIGVSDPPPGKQFWTVLALPQAERTQEARSLQLANCAVTTSGDAYQFVEIQGKRYSHIVDTRTGLWMTRRVSATVIGPDCITADSMATAVCVLGPERGLALVAKTPGTAAFVLETIDEKTVATQSPNFEKLGGVVQSPPTGAPAQPAPNGNN